MQSHWVNGAPYYHCRFPAEYALANQVEHPLNVNLREDAVIGHVDQWLARELAPHRLSETIRDLVAAQQSGTITRAGDAEETTSKIAECGRKLAQYRAALDAGAGCTTGAWHSRKVAFCTVADPGRAKYLIMVGANGFSCLPSCCVRLGCSARRP